MGEIAPLNLGDIVDRLLDLRAYSPDLAKRFEHEDELPEDEDAVLFLIRGIEESFCAAEDAVGPAKGEAYEELAAWLIRSYRYYICRLAMAPNRPWIFSFPARAKEEVRH